MDIQTEINQHLAWIENIAALLGDEEVTAQTIEELGRHDKCELGRWLLAEESKLAQRYPDFPELVASHAQFHQLASELLGALDRNEEQQAIETGERFIEMSQQVIAHLMALELSAESDS